MVGEVGTGIIRPARGEKVLSGWLRVRGRGG